MPFNDDIKTEGQFWRKNIEWLTAIYNKSSSGGGDASAANQTNGNQKTKITDGTNDATISTSTSDSVADALNRLRVSSTPHAYNGTTWDKIRSGLRGARSSVTGWLNTLTGGTFNSAGITLTNGQSAEFQLDSNGRLLTEPLGLPSVSRQLAAGSASANTALTTTCRRLSIRARSADIRYVLGTTSQTANASTSHFIAQDERLDIDVPSTTPNIAVIRAGSVDGTLEVTELT